MKRWGIVIVGLCCLVGHLQAAEPATPDVDAKIIRVAETALKAGQERNWEAYATQFHPAALQEFADLLRPALSRAESQGPGAQGALLPLFANAKSLADVLKLPPRDFFQSFMQGTTAHTPLGSNLTDVKTKVIGVLHESPELAHVVVRASRKLLNTEYSKMEVLTLRQSGDDWKLLLPDELRAVALTFQLSLAPGNVEESSATEVVEPEK